MPALQAHREVSIKSALADDTLLFASMRGSEQLGRPFEFTVSMLTMESSVKIADVLGKPLTVALASNTDGEARHFNGIVTRFRSTGWKGDFAVYEATVRPWLWLLTRTSNCCIFQELSVPDIVKKVCAAYGGAANLSVSALSGNYPVVAYCVQYRETDFDFVCRLLENAGIYFFFTHEADKHTMVLADSPGAHQDIPAYGRLRFARSARKGEQFEETVSSWSSGGEIASSTFVLNDFDFEKPATSLLATANIAAGFEQQSYEMFDYPGNYTLVSEGNDLARARIETLHGQCEQVSAVTDARGLYPGGRFTLTDHPQEEVNHAYLVTGATYEASGNDYVSGAGDFVFSCGISAIGKEHAYRPLRSIARPVVQGPQTAIVVGKDGEEIWTDKYGRVKVQFHWDRMGKSDETSSCWVRVAQGWAGKGWGAMAVPRIGMEVVVSFLEGDPDRPLVTGCVYNAGAMPPYALPDKNTVSTMKSQSSKGGEGFNELRFEDKKGAEEVFMHAERDFLRVVKNNDALKVGFETADKGDQTVDIKNDQTIKIGHDAIESIDNNQTMTIKVDQKLDVGGDQTVGIDGSQKVKVGQTIIIEAGTSIELKVGGSSIKMEAGKITIKAPEIEIAADANAKIKAGAMMEIKSGAVMTIGGALVQIN